MKKKIFLWAMLICMSVIGNAQINFPDANFKKGLLEHTDPIVDTNGDDEISITEAMAVTKLDLSLYTCCFNRNPITDLSGIEHFLNLESLTVYKQELASIDVSSNINLTDLLIISNKLTSIDVSKNLKLEQLVLSYNDISQIDISNNLVLRELNMFDTNLTSIDVSNNLLLDELSLLGNNLTQIDVTNNINLVSLDLDDSSITSIDVTNNPLLMFLSLEGNNLETLDIKSLTIQNLNVSNNPNLKSIFMTGQKTRLYLYPGETYNRILLGNTPQLEFICIDNTYVDALNELLVLEGQESVHVTTDCSLYSDENRILGTVTYDVDNDGCDTDDIPFTQYIAINIFSGLGESITVFPNEQGLYNAFINDGTYKFIPDLGQSESYFEVVDQPVFNFFEPGTTIPDDIANLTTDFCIQSIGDFDDLEVSIIPITRAVPGFDAIYEVIYTNNGTTTQSGTITLEYDSDVLVFDSATPNIVSNTNGQLTWSFNNLSPMETLQIPVTFTLNTPSDSPALNGGDILNFTATVTGATDETPDNNTFMFRQLVVNSFDPNDKTCLEGDILDPDDVGGYLHYLIRFENEGTAEAVNITVTDIIDTTKLDIESFVPLTSSHSYTTTISNENEVEFTFSNISLPFDDANNDGYVFFKIKTLDTLVEGDEIVNSAAIYFDFNLPIITEDSVVKVEREVVVAPSFSDYFTLSPNPTTGIMNLEVLDDSIEISYIVLYDLAGVFRGFYFGTVRTIDVSNLYARTYVMQILTNKGDFSTQFIKL